MTAGAAAAFQKRNGLVADGWVGPATARRLFFRPVDDAQLARSIPDNLLYGMARLESGMDPGAEGKVDDRDRGLFQFNRTYWPSITDEVAYADVTHCAKVAADSLRLAYDRLGRWDCAVASHNNPSKARTWATTGSPPDDQIANYVTAVTINANLPR
jgi:peptidoglycan hydrolase-like protein with peptidoglycan-binding domain